MKTEDLKKPAQLRLLTKKGHKKYKSMRQNVLHPLLITVSVISVIMFLFFNIVMILLLYSNIHSDMRSISGIIEQVGLAEGDTIEEPEPILNLFKKELERRDITYHANLLIVNKNGKATKSAFDFYRNEKEMIENKLVVDKGIQKNEIFSLKTDGDLLLLCLVPFHSDDEASICVYSSLRSVMSSLVSGNKAFLVIISIAIISFIIASGIISNNISKPIKALSDHMDVIGDGDFTPVHLEENTAEVQKLVVSINEMLARLEAYNTAHTTSIQNLSHDLRTPLMSIGGYAEAIKYGVMDESEAAEVIINESKRLTEVVEKMLILSQLDTLNQPVNMVPLYLVDFLKDEVKRLDGYALQKNVSIHLSFERNNVKVLADSNLLSTIIRNLVSNAIRYAITEVTVSVRDKNEETVLCVSDDGPGLSSDDLKYLFTRYYIGETGHSGLGLSTSKSAAEYMGCTMEGENRKSLEKNDPEYNVNGAIFTVHFPKYE